MCLDSMFDPEGPPESQPAGPFGSIRLLRRDEQFWVQPPAGTAPFVLPPLPMSLCYRCLATSHTFWHRHGRCMGFILMLDARTRRWDLGIPTQRCSADSACWDVMPQELAGLAPDALVAGSFQTRIIRSGEALSDVPPPCQGLHLVCPIGPAAPHVFVYVRAEGDLVAVPLRQVSVDDWAVALNESSDRLQLV